MWAVVEIGKKQYLTGVGDTLEVERLQDKKGSLSFDKVLLLVEDKKVHIGSPYLDKVKVKADILGEKKGEKVLIYKYKRRKKYRKKQGHRQIYTLLKISDIATSGVKRTAKK
ncbi:MAG: 50S ribosomal protein L21 [Candidatus Omnitrophota bacterium]|nr:MAG: 50S ribosomal protein L21 [Candidatus Omnitrophota bacterium]